MEIELPDITGIADLDLAGLTELQATLRETLTAIFAVSDDEVTPAHLELARDASAALELVEARIAEVETTADDFAAMREQFQAPQVVEDDAEAPSADTPEEEPDDQDEEPEEPVAQVREPVAASTVRKTVAARSSRPAPPAQPPAPRPQVEVHVAPDVPGYSASQELTSMDDVADAFIARTSGFRVGARGRHQAGVAVIRKPIDPEFLITTNDEETIWNAVQKAGNESRLPGGSLTAAAGWCGPNQELMEFCPGGSTEGLFDMPEIQVDRPGVRWTPGPDYSPLYDTEQFGWDFTEAEVIAGVEKPCIMVDCPDWEEVRMDAVGFCVTGSLLTRTGFPQLVRAFTAEALIAHQHRISAKLLGKVLDAADPAVFTGGLGSVAGSALAAVELIAERERSSRRWPLRETLEVVAPTWLRGALRADYSMRTGVDLQAVSDQVIAGYFAARNLRINYIYGWQQLAADAVAYPATVDLAVYRAGTFVKATTPVINLSAVYDSTNLAQNLYIEQFFEEGILVLQRCYGAQQVTVPVCVGGITGAAINEECLTAEAPVGP